MKLSENGVRFIQNWESFSSKAYKDGKTASGKQLYSIGYGHQIQPNESHLLTTTITKEQARSILSNDIAVRERMLSNALTTNLKQHEFDALFSWFYVTGKLKSDLIEMVNAKAGYPSIRKFWTSTYIKSGGVFLTGMLRRRVQEADLFGYGWDAEILAGPNSSKYQKINKVEDVKQVTSSQYAPTGNGTTMPSIPQSVQQGSISGKGEKIAIGVGVALTLIGGIILYKYTTTHT